MAEENWLKELATSRVDKWVGGVCGGLGKHTPLPSWLWRVIFSTITCFGGIGLIIYILLWIFMPKEPIPEKPCE
jgi:phage shock protein C